MNINDLNALRLSFSAKVAERIESRGLNKFIDDQLNSKVNLKEPSFLAKSPKSLADIRALKKEAKKVGKEAEKKVNQELIKTSFELKSFLIERCNQTDIAVREKINLFFQNHFVVTLQSVKLPYWIYKHYETINNYALDNYKTLVKQMVYSNAMIKYLDNHQNKKGKINENLGRELLELFTLGEGNYSENDIKNTALSLAGLTFGKEKGEYRKQLKDNSVKTVFGKSGNFKIDEVIEIIFEQPNTAYFLSEKVLKWFFYDTPPKELIIRYGDALKRHNFELKPFFKEVFEEESKKPVGGNQIKNPLSYVLQVNHLLGLETNYKFVAFLLKNQGMDIYDQPNVKGWKGGKDWLTSQIYSDRNQFIDVVIDGNERYKKQLNRKLEKFDFGSISFEPKINFNNQRSALSITTGLSDRMIFEVSDEMQAELGQLLKYDFDPKAENARQSILRVYQYLAKSPEFQII